MTPPQKFRAACYTIEGINSFAVVIYFSYLYFFFKHQFGFDDRQNLLLAALIGLVYTIASWQAGKLAGRFGYFNALKFGFGLMAVGLVAGLLSHTVAAEIVTACIANIGMCFIWPTIEALVSEDDTPEHVPHAVGIYNITWAAANAVAFFIGGTLIQKFGYHSIFYVPLAMVVVQFCLVFWVEKLHANPPPAPAEIKPSPPDPNRPSPVRAKTFLRMAWLANPFAYVAINTLLAVMPGIADKFALSPMFAGFVCSLWCFVRLGAFVFLWRWTGWHYRFRWLAASFAVAHFVVRGHSAVAEPCRAHRRANLFRRRHRLDLLLVAVLLDGRQRNQERARRHSRGGHRRGQLRRPGGRRGGAAIGCRNTPTAARLP